MKCNGKGLERKVPFLLEENTIERLPSETHSIEKVLETFPLGRFHCQKHCT